MIINNYERKYNVYLNGEIRAKVYVEPINEQLKQIYVVNDPYILLSQNECQKLSDEYQAYRPKLKRFLKESNYYACSFHPINLCLAVKSKDLNKWIKRVDLFLL